MVKWKRKQMVMWKNRKINKKWYISFLLLGKIGEG
jgi:hypothetical protein